MLTIKVQAIINRKMPLGTRMEPTLFNILTLGVTTSRVIGNCNIRDLCIAVTSVRNKFAFTMPAVKYYNQP
jgi:hypothetical protein